MDFIDTIFSFIPLLVLFLFFTRIAKAAGKKKHSEQPSPDQKTGESDIKKTESVEDFSSLMAKLGGRSAAEKIRQDFVRKKDAPAVKAAKKEPPPEAKPAPAKTINHVRPPEYQAMNSLRSKSTEIKPESVKSRFDSLPELKKAVVWAEILGKPKSLE